MRRGASGSLSAIDSKTPMWGTRSFGSARAASGHATAAPPMSVTNSRRLMELPSYREWAS
jgi:hypothetical protein